MDKNKGIGNKEKGVGKIPWRIPADLKRFKEKTLNKIVIMGRTTFDSLAWYYDRSGRPMPAKLYIVVTRDKSYKPSRENVVIIHSLEEALLEAQSLNPDEIVVGGGAQIFEQLLPKTDRLYLTLVDGEFEVDTYFPDYSDFKKEISREDYQTEDGLKYTWLTLERYIPEF